MVLRFEVSIQDKYTLIRIIPLKTDALSLPQLNRFYCKPLGHCLQNIGSQRTSAGNLFLLLQNRELLNC